MKIITENLKAKFGKRILIDEKLSNYSWFNLGGPADIFFKPDNLEDIIYFFKKLKPKKFTIIGAGSNTLIRDGGIKGITIKLSSAFSYIKLDSETIIEVGAATQDKKVANFAMDNSLTGLEFLACIPGSIGGAVKMNTGCYGDDISQIVHSIKVIDAQGKLKEILAKDIKFSYRSTNLKEHLIVTSVKLIGKSSIKKKIQEKQKAMIERKKNAQPSQIKTCGSTFKNSKNKKAWELIKESNCENFKVGNAIISEKHCNFFINNGNTTSKDLEELIKKVQKTVYQKTKINLELEIKIIGYNK
jgi:UDP-N-acetylmuramate dehydrogenase|tara:strand:- start:857 stop:1759 length:903 start_codon:yes stop_codon:yes gene_type:complete